VCQALGPWRGQISALNSQAAQQMKSATTPQQTRTNMVALLAGAQRASEDARAKVAAAGAPNVSGGAAIAAWFVSSLTAVRDAYGKARQTVEGLPTGDAKAFYDGVASAIGTLNQEYAKAGVDTGRLASAELRKDFDEVPACG
jgi:hypothetical protein